MWDHARSQPFVSLLTAVVLQYSTKIYSYMKEQSFSLHYEVSAGQTFKCYCLLPLTQVLGISCVGSPSHWCNRPATNNFWCCILWRESKPKSLLTTDSEPSNASLGIRSANKEGSGVVSWPECELSVTRPQVNSQTKIEVNPIQRQRPSLDKKRGYMSTR